MLPLALSAVVRPPRGEEGLIARLSLALALVSVAAACGATGPPNGAPASAKVQVVAVENFWGSITSQIAGGRVQVTSLITNPNTDPHDFDPTPNDARLMAGAKLVIVNGVGYDSKSSGLLTSNPVSGRVVLDVGKLLGKQDGDNPHFWYNPDYVDQVAAAITDDLKTVDPKDAASFDGNRAQFESVGLMAYHEEIAAIKQKYAGTPVGASESIFAYMAPALGLNLITPNGYMKAISESTPLSPADRVTVDQQVSDKQIKVFVYNSQNKTPDVDEVVRRAKSVGIPVTTITETLSPAGTTFQGWQTNQLKALYQALGG